LFLLTIIHFVEVLEKVL